MYSVVLPIPVFVDDAGSIFMSRALARDLAAHAQFEKQINGICPRARTREHAVDSELLNGILSSRLTLTLLPFDGGLRTLLLNARSVLSVLRREAERSEIWHTGVGTKLIDVNLFAFEAGRASPLRVLCMDSDPVAMLTKTGTLLARLRGRLLLSRLHKWLRNSDATIFIGSGVEQRYRNFARRSLRCNAVWILEKDVVNEEVARQKFSRASPMVIMAPTRLLPFKGVDDLLRAFAELKKELPNLDKIVKLIVVGAGKEDISLQRLARRLSVAVDFLRPVPFGDAYYKMIREAHVICVPTRANEEARVIYDAMASGCALLYSKTETLFKELENVAAAYPFEPGDVDSLKRSLHNLISDRDVLVPRVVDAISAIRGKSITDMHRERHTFLSLLRGSRVAPA
jgi:glycosyltransferase involved in cell wall biosynthesis